MGFRVLKSGEKLQDENGVQAIKDQAGYLSKAFEIDSRYATFGITTKGKAFINKGERMIEVQENEFFAGNIDGVLMPLNSCICYIRQPNCQIPLQMGEIEPQGRLKYIDGAFNSLLMSPPKKGDPCLNALYMSGEIDQTAHTHPSTRIGVILRGEVTVRIWDKEGDDAAIEKELLLKKGDMWFMEKDTVHSFHTIATDDMALFAFHPDSDFGPTDEEAPMINRTIIEGESAKGNNEPKLRKTAAFKESI